MDLIGEERGRLARVAGWLDASPSEALGLVVLLTGAVAATAALLWGALGRPALPVDAASTAGDVGVAAGAAEDAHDRAGPPDEHAHGDGGAGHGADPHDHGAGVDAGEPDQPAEVTVHVAGAVGEPGVVTLPAGARVTDAVDAAGGLAEGADLARVNLARQLVDGEQVLILREGEEAPAGFPGGGDGPVPAGGGAAGAGAPPGLVDLNTAGPAELETLPGIGPALAARIVAHRDQHGPFRAPGDLRDVSGIGEKRFQDLADLVTVG